MDDNSLGVRSDSHPARSEWPPRDLDMDAVAVDQVSETLNVPPNSRLVARFDERSVGAEKFRVLASRLGYLRKHLPLKRIVVTSTVKGEGKSVVSANLALTLGRRHKTLLIDGDLRQSGLANLFGLHDRRGLTDWWQETAPITSFLLRVERLKLCCLPAGQITIQPLEILQSQRTIEMLAEITELFDWVIIDAPPLVPLADPNAWATESDGTLLVVRQGMTPKRLLRKALESIENLKLIGTVMNGSQEAALQYYGQYYKRLPGNAAATPVPRA